jgi:putative hemolysin
MIERSSRAGGICRPASQILNGISLFSPLLVLLQETGADDGGLGISWSVALLAVSVLGYALVNTIEIAIIGSSRIRIRHLAEDGNRSAQALQRIREHEDRFFAIIVLLQNLSVFIASSMAGLLAVELAGGWGLVVAILVGTAGIALFGEVTPKVLGAKAADRLALIAARPTELFTVLLRPIAIVFAAAPNILSRILFGERAEVSPTVTEAELRMLIDISAREGAVTDEEAELMERVFRFYDRRVNEVLVPRTEVVWLEAGTSLAGLYETYLSTPHTRFPVYQETMDDVVGVINIKDVLRAVANGEGPDSSIDALVRPAHYVPETKLVGQLFVEMQERRQHMAVVVDEYGGTAGIVTLELLLEEMVGTVVDELGEQETEFEAIDDRTVRIDGGMSLHDAREDLNLQFPESDYETVAGYVLDVLGHIPQQGETVTTDGLRITVSAVKGRKIEEVVVTRPSPDAAPGEPPA